MKLIIDKEMKVEDVQKMFTAYYPYLKIEFYKTQRDGKLNASKKEALSSTLALHKLLKHSENTLINLDKNITVSALEKQFAEIGLTAEVFRKSGNTFVETFLTDNWTLQQQNEEAKELSHHFT